MKPVWIFVFIALFLVFLIFNILIPLIFFEELSCLKVQVSALKDYFSIMSSFSSMAISGVGAYLGYYYFKNKKEHEDTNNKKTRIRNRFEYIVSELNKYDSNVELIFNKIFNTEEDLRLIRHRIRRSFENILSMLEKNDEILGLKDCDVDIILDVFSFIDKNEQVMAYPFQKAKIIYFPRIQETYILLVKKAKILCFTKSE